MARNRHYVCILLVLSAHVVSHTVTDTLFKLDVDWEGKHISVLTWSAHDFKLARIHWHHSLPQAVTNLFYIMSSRTFGSSYLIEYVMLVNMPDTSNLAEPKLLNSTLMSGCSWLWYRLYVYTHIATIYILIWTHFLRDMFVESITLWFQWVPLFPIKTISEGLCFCPLPSHLQLFLEPFGLLRPFWWINTSGIPCA